MYIKQLSVFIENREGRLEEVLEVLTMCGHGMISKNLVAKAIDQVKRGKKTPHEAAVMVAQPCVCGIFNVSRAEKLFSKYIEK